MSYLAIDTETTGFDMFNGHRPFSIITADEDGRTNYIQLGEDDVVPIDLACMSTHIKKVFHNAKFDILMLHTCGMAVLGEVHDTMIMAHVYNPDESNKQLKHLAKKYLDEEPEDEKKLKAYIRKHKITDYSNIPRDLLEPYARTDARITMGLFRFYKNKGVLEDPTYKSEIALLHTLIRMQTRGVLIDTEYCKAESAKCAARIAEIAKKIETEYGDINTASNKQLSDFLFDQEGLSCTHYSEKGNPVLDQYNLGRYEHPIIPLIIEERQLKKAKDTYLDGILEKCDKEGVIHCDFYQIGAKTGRFSCVAGWSPVKTMRGVVPIKDVVVGDYVWTHAQRWRRVLASWMNGVRQTYDVILSNGNILTCTSDHRVLSYDRRWMTIQEVADERKQKVVSRKLAGSFGGISKRHEPDYERDCQKVSYDVPQCEFHNKQTNARSRGGSKKENTLLLIKDRFKKSYVGEERERAPELERRVGRRLRLQDNRVERETPICTPCCDDEVVGSEYASKEIRRTSHRWEPVKQFLRQLGSLYTQGTHSGTLLTGSGGKCIEVTDIVPKETIDVYDLTIEEDESYESNGIFLHNCRAPNLQNIPKNTDVDIRRAFTCRDGYTNYYFDYSQVELRIFAHYAKEQVMIDELNKDKGDLHGVTARLIFGENFTKEQRDIGKRLNFGIIYGIGAKKFAETLNEAYPDQNYTYNEAKMFIGKYYQSYPQVRKFTWKVGRAILTRGYVHDVFGRKYTCLKSETYKATNYLIQGCAAGVLKNAMINIDKILLSKKSNLLITIHDELVIEIHKDEEHLVPQIQSIMEDRTTFRVPILVNTEKTTTNWSAKE